jgi:hypothetical protein
MKTAIISIVCATGGFLLGFGFPGAGKPAAGSPTANRRPARPSRPVDPWGGRDGTAAARMRHFASQAATLAPEDWPAFFLARMRDPEGSRLAERLWAEQDPRGFWEFLKTRGDAGELLQYGRKLLETWAAADPDAAIAAANEVTEKRASDLLRRQVIDSVLAVDLEKGLALAAAALDFNAFSWGDRDWMKTDPAAAVKGLAALPAASEYRDFLRIAVGFWAKSDPAALLAWVKTQPVPERNEWFGEAFKQAAEADFSAAMATAASIADPAARDAALAGVISSGKVPGDQLSDSLARLSIPKREEATRAVLEKAGSSAEIASATLLLDDAPASKNLLGSIGAMAWKLGFRDTKEALAWSASLPDAAMRRSAFAHAAETLASNGKFDELAAAISNAPRLDLSNELFRAAAGNLTAERRAAWFAKLPPDLAAWAESAVAE